MKHEPNKTVKFAEFIFELSDSGILDNIHNWHEYFERNDVTEEDIDAILDEAREVTFTHYANVRNGRLDGYV